MTRLRLETALILCILLPGAAMTENDCGCNGSWVRSLTHFSGTIRSIELAGQRELELFRVDRELDFIVSMEIRSVEGTGLPLRIGETEHFGIHSPTLTFGGDGVVGKTVDLEAVVTACDGAFRAFAQLRPRHWNLVEDFTGGLEVGHLYRARVKRDPREGLRLLTPLQIPMHHGVRVDWKNLDRIPEPSWDGGEATIELQVVSERIWQVPGRLQWRTVYELAIR